MDTLTNTSVKKEYFKYVSQSVLGLLGVSCYILADTFFISKAAGASGITVLNLALPVYGIIFAIGSMIGVGSATRYTILKAKEASEADSYFFNALVWDIICSVPFFLAGLFAPDKVLTMMGGDAEIVLLGSPYARTFLLCTPFFMLNHLVQAYVRNDNDPGRSMIATLSSSIFNIVFDYVFMFPMGMGMVGAALATGISPMVGVLVGCTHFFSKKNKIRLVLSLPSFKKIFFACQLGVSAFVTELSSAVITAVFNSLILSRAGNIGVAAYGVIANLALVAVAIFNGIVTGMQPLVSRYYGKNEKSVVNKLLKYGLWSSLIFACVINVFIWLYTDRIIGIFNSENSAELALYAHWGLRLYFAGYLFAGINIVATGFFSAVEESKAAFISSMMRGFVIISLTAIVLAWLFGMTGIWISFAVAEGITTIIVGIFFLTRKSKH